MKLRVNKASPFARKARILIRETGLMGRLEEVETAVSPVAPNEDLARENPLIKIPALVTNLLRLKKKLFLLHSVRYNRAKHTALKISMHRQPDSYMNS